MVRLSVLSLWSEYLSRLKFLDFNKNQTNTLRGLAALAVVWHHCMLYYADMLEKFQIDPIFLSNALIKYPSILLDPVRMPLFTILSGCVYALIPVTRSGQTEKYVTGKVRRIIIPLLFVSTIKYFDLYFTYGTNPTLKTGGALTEVSPAFFWMTWFFHFGHLWFLQALFIIFMVILLIDYCGWMNSVRNWLFWLAIFAALPLLAPSSSFVSLDGTKNILFFFIFGVGLRRFSKDIFIPQVVICSWLLLTVSLAIHVLAKLDVINMAANGFEDRMLAVVSGSSAAICLFSLSISISWLAAIGNYSYSIYLYHAIVIHHVAFYSMLSHSAASAVGWFLIVVLCSVTVPIIIEKLFIDIPYLRTLALGKKTTITPNKKSALRGQQR